MSIAFSATPSAPMGLGIPKHPSEIQYQDESKDDCMLN